MKHHALFVIFEKSGKILHCRLLQIIGGALRVKAVERIDQNQWKVSGHQIRCYVEQFL